MVQLDWLAIKGERITFAVSRAEEKTMENREDNAEDSGSRNCYLAGFPELGTKVRVVDGSDAHGEIGVMWHVNPSGKMALVELRECLWPIDQPSDVEVIEPLPK